MHLENKICSLVTSKVKEAIVRGKGCLSKSGNIVSNEENREVWKIWQLRYKVEITWTKKE